MKGDVRLDVQGLRAVAVMAVILYHVNSAWLPSGFVGVDVFFVLSGFLISSIIYYKKENFDWVGFYWSRIKRIVPAYLCMLVVVSFVSAVLFIPSDFYYFEKSLKAALKFASNQYFAGFGSYFAPSAHELPLLHTWSLAVEMQFYLFLPVLICFLPKKLLKGFLPFLVVVFVIYSEYGISHNDGEGVYYSILARAPEFLLGSIVAVFFCDGIRSDRYASLAGFLGALLLVFGFLFIDQKGFPGWLVLFPCAGTALLLVARRGVVSDLLSTRGMVWVGGLSYSLYLWHWPVLAFIRYYTEKYDLQVGWLVAFFVVSFFCAWASYRWVETPIRRLQGIRSVVGCFFWGGVCVFGSVLFSKSTNSALVEALPVEMTRYAPASEICHGGVVGECKRGDQHEDVSVLVLGDSHAAQLNYFFDAVGVKNKTAFRVMTASSCVPIPGFDVERLPQFAQEACRSQIEAVKPFVSGVSTIVIAGMWQYQVKSEKFMQALEAFLGDVARRRVRVVVLAQVPMFDVNLVRIHRFAALGLPVSVVKNNEWMAANEKVGKVVRGFSNARFLDFSRSDFFDTAPFEGGVLIYHDNHHLNEIGARRYGEYASPVFKELDLKSIANL